MACETLRMNLPMMKTHCLARAIVIQEGLPRIEVDIEIHVKPEIQTTEKIKWVE